MSRCRSKNPSKCPYHGAPLIISQFREKLSSGVMPTREDLEEYDKAQTDVQAAIRRRGVLLLAAAKVQDLSVKEAEELPKQIENADDVLPFLNELENAGSPQLYEDKRSTVAKSLLKKRDGLTIKEAELALKLVKPYDESYVALETKDQNTIKILAGRDAGKYCSDLILNRNVPDSLRDKILDEHPELVFNYSLTKGYTATTDKAVKKFLANPEKYASLKTDHHLSGYSMREIVSAMAVENTSDPVVTGKAYDYAHPRSLMGGRGLNELAHYNSLPVKAIRNHKGFPDERIPGLVKDSYVSSEKLSENLAKRPGYSKEMLKKLGDKNARPFSTGWTDKDQADYKHYRSVNRRKNAWDQKRWVELNGKRYGTEKEYTRLTRAIAKFKANGEIENNPKYDAFVRDLADADLYRDHQHQLALFAEK